MPVPPCPACNRPRARRLEAASDVAPVNYYICDSCRHRWTTDKDDGSIVAHITPLIRPNYPTN